MSTQDVMEHESDGNETLKKWVGDYGQTLLYGLIIVAAILLFFFRYSSANRSQAQVDYMKADVQYLDYKVANDATPPEALVTLLAQHPDLGAKYNAAIAQLIICRNDDPLGVTWGKKVLSSPTLQATPPFRSYAEGTLAITAGDFAAAAELTESNESGMLNAFSQMRLALLAKQGGETPSWDTLQAALTPEFIAHLDMPAPLIKEFFQKPMTLK